jgi:hypothetical protein
MFKSLDFENLQIKVSLNTVFLLFIYCCLQVTKLALTFKEIIYSYRKQPHCKPQVFRSVYVHWPSRSRSGVKLHLVLLLVTYCSNRCYSDTLI